MLKCDFLGLAGKSWMLKTDIAFVLATLQADIQALERKKSKHKTPIAFQHIRYLFLLYSSENRSLDLKSESFSLNLPPSSTAMCMLGECF